MKQKQKRENKAQNGFIRKKLEETKKIAIFQKQTESEISNLIENMKNKNLSKIKENDDDNFVLNVL